MFTDHICHLFFLQEQKKQKHTQKRSKNIQKGKSRGGPDFIVKHFWCGSHLFIFPKVPAQLSLTEEVMVMLRQL